MLLRLQPHLLLQKVPAPIPATVPIGESQPIKESRKVLLFLSQSAIKAHPFFFFLSFFLKKRSRWLAAHNDIRRRYSVPDLVWDPKLEAVAQGHADTCIFKHSTSGYGEVRSSSSFFFYVNTN
ncbi:hypothetical protein PGT21_017881 [Puccinia graminis f. sp. tritici]|uniref:SCP domain-containing protein n=1 Tax=Puccinia graminis f. sp. tritici TaxID=56615 RepID=A0A5B0PKR9_PUCGR|nr:hypothetical protein PGT21_017881 [Puccinia graminis f. sp. tritici]